MKAFNFAFNIVHDDACHPMVNEDDGVWWQSPQRCVRPESLVRIWGSSSPKAEYFCISDSQFFLQLCTWMSSICGIVSWPAALAGTGGDVSHHFLDLVLSLSCLLRLWCCTVDRCSHCEPVILQYWYKVITLQLRSVRDILRACVCVCVCAV